MPPTRTYAAICEDLDRVAGEWHSSRSKSLYEAIGGLIDEMAKRHRVGVTYGNPLFEPADAHQEFCVGMLSALTRWDPLRRASFVGYALSRGIGRVKDTYTTYHTARKRKEQGAWINRYADDRIFAYVSGPAKGHPHADSQMDVKRTIHILNPSQRKAFDLYTQGYFMWEIGDLMGRTEQMVSLYLHKAVRVLRSALHAAPPEAPVCIGTGHMRTKADNLRYANPNPTPTR